MNLDIVRHGKHFFEGLPKASFAEAKCIRSDISNTSRNDSPHSAKLRNSKFGKPPEPYFKR